MSGNYTQVWAELEDALEGALSDSEYDTWGDLVLLYANNKCSWVTLFNTIHGARKAYGQVPEVRERLQRLQHTRPASDQTKSKKLERQLTRTQVLTEIIAEHAGRNQEVIQFREEILRERLLPWDEVQGWITQEHVRERQQELPRIALMVPLPASAHLQTTAQGGMIPNTPLCIDETHPARGTHRESLDYAIPNDDWVHRIPIAYGGILARLQQLSTTLAQRYQWQPALATVFVLTGLSPVLQPIKTAYHWSELQTQAGSVTALSRIVLTIDPTVTPKEVSTAFQHIRQYVLGARWRDLADWQLALAQFTLQRADAELWPQRFEAWNKKVIKKWRSDTVSNFKRACQNAIEKLLAPISSTHFFSQREDSHAETPRES
jgi:hypothetical protein